MLTLGRVFLIQLLLPVKDNEGRPFPRGQFDAVRVELTEHFGGVTAFLQSPASGAWKEEGETVEDELVLYEVLCDALDRGWWKAYRESLQVRFKQELIVARAFPVEML